MYICTVRVGKQQVGQRLNMTLVTNSWHGKISLSLGTFVNSVKTRRRLQGSLNFAVLFEFQLETIE
jgi:hypothetical protein